MLPVGSTSFKVCRLKTLCSTYSIQYFYLDHLLSSHSEELPGEFDDEELAAYAEERAVLQDLEDCTDEIFSLSDFEDVDDLDKPFQHRTAKSKAPDGDVYMCL